MKLFLCCLFLLIFSCQVAQGMVIRQVSLKEVVDLCTDVCVGLVDRLEAERDPWSGMIYTLATIRVEECTLGAVQDSELTVKTLGGEVGDIGVFVPGAAVLEEGEEVLLFLVDDGEGSYRVIHGAMGKYTITEDPFTGQKSATNSVEGIQAIEGSAGEGSAHLAERTSKEGSINGPLPRQILLDNLIELIGKAKWR